MDINLEKIYNSIKTIEFCSDYNSNFRQMNDKKRKYHKNFCSIDGFLLFVVKEFNISDIDFEIRIGKNNELPKYRLEVITKIESFYGNEYYHIINYKINKIGYFMPKESTIQKLENYINNKLVIHNRCNRIDELLDI